MTGIEAIAKERKEQIKKHKRTIIKDVELNAGTQLRSAARRLLEICPNESDCPTGWDRTLWNKMASKPYKERLIIAGALIAAEYDRVTFQESNDLS